MNKKLAKKWAEALESGKYEQTRNYLKCNGKYCCLGVLFDVVFPEETQGQYLIQWDDKIYLKNSKADEVHTKFEMNNDEMREFADANDVKKLDFVEIAKLVREKYKVSE